jgi:hypothetical protein
MHLCAAIDPGNGNTNAALRLPGGALKVASLQSSVARPVETGQVFAAMRGNHRATTRRVEFDNEVFVVGPGAWKEGRPEDTVLGNLYHVPTRRALMYAALAQLLPPGTDPNAIWLNLIIGLPVGLLQNDAQATMTKKGLAAFKGPHKFRVDGVDYAFTVPDIKGSMEVHSQPYGAFMDWRIGDDLSANPAHNGAGEVVVWDPGMGTFDILGIDEDAAGKLAPARGYVAGGDLGVHWLLAHVVEETGFDLAELDARLRTNRLTIAPEKLDEWLNKLLVMTTAKVGSYRKLKALIPTGGGVLLLGEMRLREAFMAKQAPLYWPEDPLTANVRGLWKHGERKLQKQTAEKAVA